MQPKLSAQSQALLDGFGLKASLYQPTYLFVKNNRKMPNCAEPGDPWECFLRRADGEFGVVARAFGLTPDEAVLIAIRFRPGLTPAMARLTHAVADLVETLQCL